MDTFCGHFLWTFLWTRFDDTFCGNFFMTLFVDTLCGLFLWTLFVDTFCGHFFVDTFCGHFLWTLFFDTFCGHFLGTLFLTLFVKKKNTIGPHWSRDSVSPVCGNFYCQYIENIIIRNLLISFFLPDLLLHLPSCPPGSTQAMELL